MRAQILNMQVTEVIFGKRPQGSEGASHAHTYRKSIPGKRNHMCKGPK